VAAAGKEAGHLIWELGAWPWFVSGRFCRVLQLAFAVRFIQLRFFNEHSTLNRT
jgi:hypothetical protein